MSFLTFREVFQKTKQAGELISPCCLSPNSATLNINFDTKIWVDFVIDGDAKWIKHAGVFNSPEWMCLHRVRATGALVSEMIERSDNFFAPPRHIETWSEKTKKKMKISWSILIEENCILLKAKSFHKASLACLKVCLVSHRKRILIDRPDGRKK